MDDFYFEMQEELWWKKRSEKNEKLLCRQQNVLPADAV